MIKYHFIQSILRQIVLLRHRVGHQHWASVLRGSIFRWRHHPVTHDGWLKIHFAIQFALWLIIRSYVTRKIIKSWSFLKCIQLTANDSNAGGVSCITGALHFNLVVELGVQILDGGGGRRSGVAVVPTDQRQPALVDRPIDVGLYVRCQLSITQSTPTGKCVGDGQIYIQMHEN